MPIRDIVLLLGVLGSVPFVLRQPWLGVLLWNGLALLNPHRYAWGLARHVPFSLVAAGATLAGLFLSSAPKRMPRGPVVVLLVLFTAWMTVTTLFSQEPHQAWPYWERVIKINFMVLVGIALITTRQQLYLLVWVVVLALGFFGVKGGLFTIAHGGAYRVGGPSGSFIEDNNALALALLMVLPLMRYLHLSEHNKWLRFGLLFAMATTSASVLGSWSRGAFVAGAATIVFLIWKSRKRIMFGALALVGIPLLLSLLPDAWWERMATINPQTTEASAQSRLTTWRVAWEFALDHPITGGGFEFWRREIFQRYTAGEYETVHTAHSIYFQVLAEQGFPGLFLFLLLWLYTWHTGSWIVRRARDDPNYTWAGDLARMCQVTMVAYAVGGTFLGMAHFDLPYLVASFLVICKRIMEEELHGRHPGNGSVVVSPDSRPTYQTSRTQVAR